MMVAFADDTGVIWFFYPYVNPNEITLHYENNKYTAFLEGGIATDIHDVVVAPVDTPMEVGDNVTDFADINQKDAYTKPSVNQRLTKLEEDVANLTQIIASMSN